MRFIAFLHCLLLLMGTISSSVWSQSQSVFPEYLPGYLLEGPFPPPAPQSSANEYPYITYRVHKNGRFQNTVMNMGVIGNVFGYSDVGHTAPSYYFPGYSRKRHGLFTGIWVGGVVNRDTLVSTSIHEPYWWWRPYIGEFWPDTYPNGDFTDETGSSNPLSPGTSTPGEVVYSCIYTDTFKNEPYAPFNEYDYRRHWPLNIQIKQTTYTWSYSYAEDIMIVDYRIGNIGSDTIHDAYVGLYHLGANHYIGEVPWPKLDDIEGLLRDYPADFPELPNEKMDIAWTCDVDGWPFGGGWSVLSTRNVFGVAPLRTPGGSKLRSFNWWTNTFAERYNWGPRRVRNTTFGTRRFATGGDQPGSDKDRYWLMANPEIDYTGYEASMDYTNEGWQPPHENAEFMSDGHFVQMLISFGPFTLAPGAAEHLTVAMAVGEDIHTVATEYRDRFNRLNPQPFLDYLNFDDLVTNIRWAKRIFDNPGVDTDHDGDSGKYFIRYDSITGESTQVYLEGDGVPDFRGATPPPPPPLRVKTEEGRITVRWNGEDAENYFDPFSSIRDFEGYRVYIARSLAESDIAVVASWDREDYSRFKYHRGHRRYQNLELPFTIEQLRAIYGEDFEPLDYTINQPLVVTPPDGGTPDKYYFTKVDHNQSDYTNPRQIHKIYPDALLDTADVDEEGRMRYYEYEIVLENLLPSIPYYVCVTAFDFGYPARSLGPLESSPWAAPLRVFAVDEGDAIFDGSKNEDSLDVYVWPNPYRIDGGYAALGLENRFINRPADKARRIYFGNLPNKCTITIYTIDGDLIQTIEHNEITGAGTSSVAEWNLISRNHQAVVSGLYFWVVESEFGNQIGKLSIIK